jgi:multidrug efflux pump
VDVQNRLARATPRLPAAVTQQGVRVDKSRNNFLLFTILSSDDPKYDAGGAGRLRLAQRAARTAAPARRRPGAAVRHRSAMRIWIDPAKLQGFNLSAADVNNAIRAQNAQVSSGTIGDLPNITGQAIAATVVVNGQLSQRGAVQGTSCCAPTPTARPCG